MPKLPDQLIWNPAKQVWEHPQTDLSGQREPFLATFPKEGTMRNGVLYPHQTQAQPTEGNEFSFLPTPATSDRFGANKPGTRGGSDALRTVACFELFRSPTLSDVKTPDRSGLRAAKGHQTNLADQIEARFGDNPEQDWGQYETAVRRWESVMESAAPAPTEPNRNNRPRLKAAFSEWLMGWPEGWVTNPEIGLSRAAQLRMIGNGVVPQQAVAALRKLLED